MRLNFGLILACFAALVGGSGFTVAPAPVASSAKSPKGTAISRAIEAIDKAGGTYGVRQLGGPEFAEAARRLGYDERTYYDVSRLSFGRVNGKEPLGKEGLAAVAEHIATFPRLETLDLRGNDLATNYLASLPPLPKLRTLRLDEARITDAALPMVAERFPALTDLELVNTAVTPAGEVVFNKLLPKCKVTRLVNN